MKRGMAIVAVIVTAGMAGCDDGPDAAEAALRPPPAVADRAAPAPAALPASAATSGAIVAKAAASPAAPGAPAFAVLYPDAATTAEPTLADGPSGPGGLTTFVTDASPEEVVAFYRQRAEAEGLSSVMAMNQGAAQAYGAASSQADGPSLQVVASPAPEGGANVQLSWSAGQ